MSRPDRFVVSFEHEKETKNTHKYAESPEPGQPPRIGALYIQKWALGAGDPPRQLTVTVDAGTGASEGE